METVPAQWAKHVGNAEWLRMAHFPGRHFTEVLVLEAELMIHAEIMHPSSELRDAAWALCHALRSNVNSLCILTLVSCGGSCRASTMLGNTQDICTRSAPA